MVNCPKCGFSQPQDQYCASCGVDMLAFKPKEKPVYLRIVANTAFQLSTIALVVLSFFLVIHHQQKLELAARISDIEDASPNQIIQRKVVPPKEADLASTTPDAAPPIDDGEALETGAAVQIASAATEPQTNAATLVAAPSAPATTSAAAAAPTSPKTAGAASGSVRVSFDEIPRGFVTDLINDPDSAAGSYGTISYGAVADWATRSRTLSSVPNFHALDSTSPQTLGVGETTTVYRGPRDDSAPEQLGVWIYVKLVRSDESGATVSVEVSRSILDPNATGEMDSLSRLPLPEVTVPKGGAMFVSGLLPHRPGPLTPNEQRLYRNDPVLRVITSEAFHGGYTDLGIFIEPK